MKTMKLSPLGRKFLALQEGYRSKAYKDAVGLASIGVGHLLTRQELMTGRIEINGEPIKYGLYGLTQRQVFDLLGQDVGRFENAVNHAINVPLAQHQFDAMVSLAFNIGACAFKESSLVKDINAGRMENVPAQFLRWNRAAGKILRGLERRRRAEVYLWEHGYEGEGLKGSGGVKSAHQEAEEAVAGWLSNWQQ